jgi:hypothetical protein
LKSFSLSDFNDDVFLNEFKVLSNEYIVWFRASWPIGKIYSVISNNPKFGEIASEQNIFKGMSMISLKSGNDTTPSNYTCGVGLPFELIIIGVLFFSLLCLFSKFYAFLIAVNR